MATISRPFRRSGLRLPLQWLSTPCRRRNIRCLAQSAAHRPEESFDTPAFDIDASGPPSRHVQRSWASDRESPASLRSADRSHGRLETSPVETSGNAIIIPVDGELQSFHPILLRDLCRCPRCLDASTKQKLFSTADIPVSLRARDVRRAESGVSISWERDLAGYDANHVTELDWEVLRDIARPVLSTERDAIPKPTPWDARDLDQLQDIDYDAYMQDDSVLLQALHQLQTRGLVFLSNVRESAEAVSAIAERIGPVKNTFYGSTWDVRSVPQATNVAYTSQHLGFHMDLMYMHQPPRLQFLHCIRSSSSAGGASLFTDSYKAASDLFRGNRRAFAALAALGVAYHYDHPQTHLYHQTRPVFELRHPQQGGEKETLATLDELANATTTEFDILDHLSSVAWSPPFQAPFPSSAGTTVEEAADHQSATPIQTNTMNHKITRWHAAAREFSALIHRPAGIHERLMKPGECVLFDNRRVLHARTAFEVADAGKERWLRGAYVDDDPFVSRMRVLGRRYTANDSCGYERMGRGEVGVD